MNVVKEKQKSSPQSWDYDDDKLLIQLKEIEHLGWKQIAKYFNNRTSNACQFRWRRLKSGQLKKVHKNKKLLNNNNAISNKSSLALSSSSTIDKNDIYISEKKIPIKNLLKNNTDSWTIEEDNLLRSRVSKKLSIVELSILMPNRNIVDIENRIETLEHKKLSIASLLTEESVSPISTTTSELELNRLPLSVSSKKDLNLNNPTKQFSVYQTSSSVVLPPIQTIIPVDFFTNNYTRTSINDNCTATSINTVTTFSEYPYQQTLPPLSKVYSLLNQ
jgi:hypothetical protein